MKKLLLVAAIGVAGFMSANVSTKSDIKLKESTASERQLYLLARDWKIEYGYGDNGSGCLVYGRYLTGDNGETIFIACGRCVGFAEICPPEGGAFA
ncbi:hypothetical protein IQ37_08255 [Chryseobacterium piperi]|uniref:Uncharacterized protein n=1 Tax=Chryseobacterium piperi TaxID=558152 RepID=A0A086BJ47_9FLAO|nr:hypothetical protein [Chryseobacterium piperi]ASW75925.1 hypothetical protein CJF12_17715 [Chryseobacterium piperi]KFF28961.1 hypothetical protein IQ37_08255 [Chryseobacterium piperi]